MIDIHSHLLPGVDDGSVSIEQSLEQLRILSQSGVKKLYLTPHFMRNIYHNTKERTEPVYKRLQEAVIASGIEIELELGCEYFLDNKLKETVIQEGLEMGSSRYVLFETTLQQIPKDIFNMTYDIQKEGYKLIFAHPERYKEINRHPDMVEELKYHDIYLQLNAGSFLGYYGRQAEQTAWRLLEKGSVHFIASDNHGDHSLSAQKSAYEMISEVYSKSVVDQLFIENPGRIGNGEKIAMENHWRLPAKKPGVIQKLKEFFLGYE